VAEPVQFDMGSAKRIARAVRKVEGMGGGGRSRSGVGRSPGADTYQVRTTSGTPASGYYPGEVVRWDVALADYQAFSAVKLRVPNGEELEDDTVYDARPVGYTADGDLVYDVVRGAHPGAEGLGVVHSPGGSTVEGPALLVFEATDGFRVTEDGVSAVVTQLGAGLNASGLVDHEDDQFLGFGARGVSRLVVSPASGVAGSAGEPDEWADRDEAEYEDYSLIVGGLSRFHDTVVLYDPFGALAPALVWMVGDDITLLIASSNGGASFEVSDSGAGVQTMLLDGDGLELLPGSAYRIGSDTGQTATTGGASFVGGLYVGGSITTFSTEDAQDAVGNNFQDTDTIDAVYNDGAGTFSWNARLQMSLTSDGSGIKLVGDSATPGNNKVYGTDGSGNKGWYAAGLADGDYGDVTIGSGGTVITINNNKVEIADLVDAASGCSVIVRAANTSGAWGAIAASDGNVLRRSGTTLGFGAIATAGLTDACVTYAKIQNVTIQRLLGRKGTSGPPEELTISEALDALGSSQGYILCRGASSWQILGAGTTGQVLTSVNSTSVPTWSTPAAAASQAEQEAGSSTSVYVTPGRQHFHDSAAKAWVHWDGSSGSTLDDYGTSGVSRTATGTYTVTWDTAFSSANYACVVSCNLNGACHPDTFTSTTVRVRTRTGTALDDAVTASAVAYGDLP
jgi:hypothetical protein